MKGKCFIVFNPVEKNFNKQKGERERKTILLWRWFLGRMWVPLPLRGRIRHLQKNGISVFLVPLATHPSWKIRSQTERPLRGQDLVSSDGKGELKIKLSGIFTNPRLTRGPCPNRVVTIVDRFSEIVGSTVLYSVNTLVPEINTVTLILLTKTPFLIEGRD